MSLANDELLIMIGISQCSFHKNKLACDTSHNLSLNKLVVTFAYDERGT